MTDSIPDKHGLAPTPWRVSESVGGKYFMYDANDKVIIVPNVSSTNRSTQELRQIYTTIVFAVNKLAEQQDEEFRAWDNFDKKIGESQ